MHIYNLQREVNARWEQQLNNPCHSSADAEHALLHITKAAGKLASALNDAQHEGRAFTQGEVGKYAADLVICAARFCGNTVDLDVACESRLSEKFPIDSRHDQQEQVNVREN